MLFSVRFLHFINKTLWWYLVSLISEKLAGDFVQMFVLEINLKVNSRSLWLQWRIIHLLHRSLFHQLYFDLLQFGRGCLWWSFYHLLTINLQKVIDCPGWMNFILENQRIWIHATHAQMKLVSLVFWAILNIRFKHPLCNPCNSMTVMLCRY